MCGKFTAMASWAEVVAFSQPLTGPAKESDGGGDSADNDYEVTYRPYAMIPVIVWDALEKKRNRFGVRVRIARRRTPQDSRSEYPDPSKAVMEAITELR